MKKQLSATKFKLKGGKPGTHDMTIAQYMELQVDALKAMATRKAWVGPDYFWPPEIPGVPNTDDNVKTSPEYRERWIVEFIRCLGAESHELLDMMNWKHWKETKQPVDWEEAKFEAVDQLMFLLNIVMAMGMGPDELAQRFEHKVQINIARQKSNY